jgi:hypothetical protein
MDNVTKLMAFFPKYIFDCYLMPLVAPLFNSSVSIGLLESKDISTTHQFILLSLVFHPGHCLNDLDRFLGI